MQEARNPDGFNELTRSCSMLDVTDAKALTIPHIVLASKDEPAEAVAGYADVIANGKGGVVETYPTMVYWHLKVRLY